MRIYLKTQTLCWVSNSCPHANYEKTNVWKRSPEGKDLKVQRSRPKLRTYSTYNCKLSETHVLKWNITFMNIILWWCVFAFPHLAALQVKSFHSNDCKSRENKATPILLLYFRSLIHCKHLFVLARLSSYILVAINHKFSVNLLTWSKADLWSTIIFL